MCYFESMGRSAVLTGKLDARDRAKQRHRGDRRRAGPTDPYDAIEDWLEQSSYRTLAPEAMRQLDTTEYLAATGHIPLEPGERLRQLAMFVEVEFARDAPDALDRLYEQAVRFRSEDPALWHSRGISAKYVASVTDRSSSADRFSKLGLRCLQRAWELDPEHPGHAYSLGKWHYEFGTLTDASAWFERTLELDPKHGWALLYRAHCLHDAKRWDAAVRAYDAVPLGTFQGKFAWAVDLILEAQAHCRRRAHDQEGALRDFERLLDRLLREPHRAHMLPLHYLRAACEGPYRDALLARYRRLEARI